MTKKQMENTYQKMPNNFMTPDVRKWEVVGINESFRVVELSRGVGISGEEIWGVSEFEEADTRYGLESTKRSKLFTDKEEAHKFYLNLTY